MSGTVKHTLISICCCIRWLVVCHSLKWVILRPSIVYGIGDLTGLTPRISCAAVYKKINEKMKFLWGKELKLSTVHVMDVCSAIWIAAT